MTRGEAYRLAMRACEETWNEKTCRLIKKALEQEPTYYPPCIDCNKKMDEIRRAYDKLKEQEPKTGWIPVSERLPEENGVYLVSLNTIGFPHISIDVFIASRQKWEQFGYLVTAWMLLPEPYTAESEE